MKHRLVIYNILSKYLLFIDNRLVAQFRSEKDAKEYCQKLGYKEEEIEVIYDKYI